MSLCDYGRLCCVTQAAACAGRYDCEHASLFPVPVFLSYYEILYIDGQPVCVCVCVCLCTWLTACTAGTYACELNFRNVCASS